MSEKTPKSQLGLFSATAAVIATMIGAGIFGATGGFAHQLGSDSSVLLVWLFCGLLALTGALSLGELGAMMPRSGGSYAYNRYIYGETAGYLSGVLSWLLAFVGATAYITLLLGHHVAQVIPGLPPALTASMAIVIFTSIHALGLREGNRVNNFFTIFKVGVIIAFIIAGYSVPAQTPEVAHGTVPDIFSAPFAAAMISASFAYLGWETTTWIAGDLRNPQKNLPRSLIAGTGLVTILYLLLNAVFLRANSAAAMDGEIESIGLHTANLLFSGNVSHWFNIMIIVVLLSTTSTVLMVGARFLAAMARDGQLPAVIGRTTRWNASINALIVQAVITVGFVCAASSHHSADAVLIFIGLPTTIIMGAAVAGVFVLRHREPDAERPFRVPLYPLPPLLFVVLAIWMVIETIQFKWQASIGSLAVILVVWAMKPLLAKRPSDSSASDN